MPSEEHESPHDALFKRVFANAAEGGALLRAIVPAELSARVGWSRLELRSGGYVDPALRSLQSDLVFAAPLGQGDVWFYVLLEHQSTPDPSMAWRMWRYQTRLWERSTQHERARRPPLVVPIVVYHGRRRWNAPGDIADLVAVGPEDRTATGELLPRYRYLLDDLGTLDVSALRARGLSAFGTLALWALRTASDRGFAGTVVALADLLGDLRRAEGGPQAVHTLVSYLSVVSRGDEPLVDEVVGRLAARGEYVVDLIEMANEKQRREGHQEMFLMVLKARFGEVPAEIARRVRECASDELQRRAERLLSAERVESVFDD